MYKLLLLIVLFVVSCSDIKTQQPKFVRKTIFHEQYYATQLVKMVYIEPSFTAEEQNEINKAISEWNEATDFVVEFKPIQYDINLTSILLENNGLIISKIKAKDDILFSLEGEPKEGFPKIVGYYYEKSFIPMILIVSDRLTINEYKQIVTHELGHAIGLIHQKHSLAIMNPYLSDQVPCLTSSDLGQFCDIFNCNYEHLNPCDR